MVGGRIIEIRPMRLADGTEVIRLWCVDNRPSGGWTSHDECCVYAEPSSVMPRMHESIWWQAGQIMFDGDRRSVRKIGYSFSPEHA